MASDPRNEELLNTLATKLIPWVKADGIGRVVFGQPPFQVPPGVSATRSRVRLSRKKRLKGLPYVYLNWWPEQGMHILRFIQIACVYEGLADYRIGDQLLSLPERTFFVVPPHIPHSDGLRSHWERPEPEKAHSRIFWLHILPSVTICHICSTNGVEHGTRGQLCIRDPYLESHSNNLIEVMQQRTAKCEELASSLLLSILLSVKQHLVAGQSFPTTKDHIRDSLTQPTSIVQRACDYIQTHMDQPLSLSHIAASNHVSSRHLSRCFQEDKGMGVMEYVTKCRLETAMSLLEDTDLPIREVSRIAGYTSATYFTQAFTQAQKMSPTAFRKRHIPVP